MEKKPKKNSLDEAVLGLPPFAYPPHSVPKDVQIIKDQDGKYRAMFYRNSGVDIKPELAEPAFDTIQELQDGIVFENPEDIELFMRSKEIILSKMITENNKRLKKLC